MSLKQNKYQNAKAFLRVMCMLVLLPLNGCGSIPGVDSLMSVFDKGKNQQFKNTQYLAQKQSYDPRANAPLPQEALSKAAQYKRSGKLQAAVNILGASFAGYPTEPNLAAEYGKVLTAMGRPQDAQNVLIQALNLGVKDWRVFSALGVAYDRGGQHKHAQKAYASALAISPYQAAVYNNLGLSYAYEGDMERAEEALSKAMTLPGANQKIKSNLKVVQGYSGITPDEDYNQGELDLSGSQPQAYAPAPPGYGGQYPQTTSSIGNNQAGRGVPVNVPQVQNYNQNANNPQTDDSSTMLGGQNNQPSLLGSSSDLPANSGGVGAGGQGFQQKSIALQGQYPTAPNVGSNYKGNNVVVPVPLGYVPSVGTPNYSQTPHNIGVNVPGINVPSAYNPPVNGEPRDANGRSKIYPWQKIKKMDEMFIE